MRKGPVPVQDWIVLIRGVTYFVHNSRVIQFAINLHQYIMTMTLLFITPQYVRAFIIASLIVYVPVGIVAGLDNIAYLGKMLEITDEDLSAFAEFFCSCCVPSGRTSKAGGDGENDGDSEPSSAPRAAAPNDKSTDAGDLQQVYPNARVQDFVNPLHSDDATRMCFEMGSTNIKKNDKE